MRSAFSIQHSALCTRSMRLATVHHTVKESVEVDSSTVRQAPTRMYSTGARGYLGQFQSLEREDYWVTG